MEREPMAEEPDTPREMAGAESEREAAVVDALRDVLDPCSCMTEDPISIVALGLVDDVTVTGSTASVRLLLTSEMCTYFVKMAEEAERRVLELPGIDRVEVRKESESVWTPARMSAAERRNRRERFERRMADAGITPVMGREADDSHS
jgi:ATP-binding protein involved in chromosome partitioning